jgi:hypothetical protein
MGALTTDDEGMSSSSVSVRVAAHCLPIGVSVLCGDCAAAVPLVLFVAGPMPARQVACPSCRADVVLHDAW